MPTFDFVVAGSGAGGAAAAARLASGGARVLLAESGPRARPRGDALEAVYRYYEAGGMAAALGNCLLPIPTGTTLGGTTTINSGTCLRTPPEMLHRWERALGGAFSAAGFGRYLDEAWSALGAREAPEATMSEPSRLFLRGLERLGIPGGHRLSRAERGCDGSARCCFVCPNGAKQSSDKAFLEPLEGDARLVVACETTLRSLVPRGRGVRVQLSSAAGRLDVRCGAVILACGALRTPALVRRLRLGPAHRLAGDELSVHPAAKLFALFDEPVRGWRGVPQGAGLVDPEDPRIRYEGVQVPPELAATTMPLEGLELRGWLSAYERLASFGFMIRDESRGRVRYPLGARLPHIRYDLEDGDRRRMLRAMKFLGKVFFAAGARAVLLPLNLEHNVFRSAGALERADLSAAPASCFQMMAFHPLGTCGMGRVVDGSLRLDESVYVCDGSVVPESLGVNPQVTISALGLRLADALLGVRNAG